MAVGQVDVLVGVPTLNNAGSVGRVVAAVHRALRDALQAPAHRPHQLGRRLDRRHAGDRAERLPRRRRDPHRIPEPAHHAPHQRSLSRPSGKAGALQTLFAAAELLQARAVALFDADVTSIDPDWVERLVRPVYRDAYDFVAPIYARHAFDGLLVTQLARPLWRGRTAIASRSRSGASSPARAASRAIASRSRYGTTRSLAMASTPG
jgi:hypothetical protein